MWLQGDNVAILPREVNTKLALFEVVLLTLDSVKEVRIDRKRSRLQQDRVTFRSGGQ
jgi:hypothetical protein